MKRWGQAWFAVLSLGLIAACSSASGPGKSAASSTSGGGEKAASGGGYSAATGRNSTNRGEPTGTLKIISGLGTERWLLRTSTGEAPLGVIGEPLVWWDWATDTPTAGAILQSWEHKDNADGSVDWTFKIKPGVKFYPADKGHGNVTADDIKFTFTEFLKPGSTNANTSIFVGFFGADPKNLTVVDDLTLKIHSPKKLNLIELFRVLGPDDGGRTLRPFSKKYFERVGEDEFARHPVFAGPYQFVSQVPGVSATVKANPDHFRQKPGFETILFLNNKIDATTVISMLKTGEADISVVSPKDVKGLESANLTIVKTEQASEPFIGLGGLYPTRPQYNAKSPWTGADPMSENSIKVRKALSLAVDRQAILDKILLGYGTIGALSFSYIGPGNPWWNPAWKPDPFDPAQAKKLMTEAGYPNCFSFKLSESTGDTIMIDIGNAVAAMWEKNLGCKVEIVVRDYRPAMRGMLENRTSDGWAWAFNGGPIARPTRYSCLHGGPTYATLTHTELPFFTDYCSKLDVETDVEKQIKMERELGDLVYKSYPTIPIASITQLSAIGPKVGSWDTVSPRKGPTNYLEFLYPKR